MIHPTADISEEAIIGKKVRIWHQAQVREGARVGDDCIVAKNVYIDKGVVIGDHCKIQNNCSLYRGTKLERGVFMGPHCITTNDKHPRAITREGKLKHEQDWEPGTILIKEGASLGARAVILPNITIGEFALIGAGSVVTKDVPAYGLMYGNPARLRGYVCPCGRRLEPEKKAGEQCSFCLSEN